MRNAIVDQILMERMNRRGGYDGRDYARGDYGRGGYDGRRGRDYGRDCSDYFVDCFWLVQ